MKDRNWIYGVLIAAALLCGYMAMKANGADNFIRGFDFTSATGLITGAELEDLLTRAQLASSAFDPSNTNRLFDTTVFTGKQAGATWILTLIPYGITSGYIASNTIGMVNLGTALQVSLSNSTPVGTIIAFGGTNPPTGYLECDGASYSTSTYASLHSAIGYTWGTTNAAWFNVPDLRGMFLRGFNHGSTNAYKDPDAASRTNFLTGGASADNVGSYQTSTNKAHTHFLNHTDNSGSGARLLYALDNKGTVGTTNTASSGGTESRPNNASVMYAIKY